MASDLPPSLPEIAGHALHDLRHYLSCIEPGTYQAPQPLLSGSSIGQHTRHIIEFYTCLLEQYIPDGQPVINYAVRRRDYRIESEPAHALRMVDEICLRLTGMDATKACLLNCAEHGREDLLTTSTIGRELVYNIEHTIHHLAIIKIALKVAAPHISLPEHFGVAPSTIHHRQDLCVQ